MRPLSYWIGTEVRIWLTPSVGIRWFAWDVCEIGTLYCALATWKMYRNKQLSLKIVALFILIAGTPRKTTTAPEDDCGSCLSSPRLEITAGCAYLYRTCRMVRYFSDFFVACLLLNARVCDCSDGTRKCQNCGRPDPALNALVFSPSGENTLSRCAKCKVALYCTRACQAMHWRTHKQECRTVEGREGLH